MSQVDFSRINGFKKGQRNSFEELVCQLARREPNPDTSVFRRVDGAGGDGGVEAYWLDDDGTKSGFQAKFHLKSGDIDWTKVDQSVRQTLESHPTLDRYTVAFPCDLTDRRGVKNKGKTGWDTWTAHAATWQAWATELGRGRITFTAWTESDLLDRLARPVCAGLRLFWFGATELTPEWFSRHVKTSVALLDERFHPEDHVDVELQTLFDTMHRRESVVHKLDAALTALSSAILPIHGARKYQNKESTRLLDRFLDACTGVQSLSTNINEAVDQPWDVTKWRTSIAEARNALRPVQRWLQDKVIPAPKNKSASVKSELNEISQSLRSYGQALNRFESHVTTPAFDAENERLAFVMGEAGTGKSHLFGHEAQEAAQRSQPTILLLGQQFSDGDAWSQIASMLDLPGVSSDTLLGALSAAGEANRSRALILIDGINEGIGSFYWKNQLAGFLSKLKPYPGVACIVSCRSAYGPFAIPPALRAGTRTFDLRGFASQNEQLRAAQVYLDRRGIARPSTPWLSPEFINPLFLRTTCLALALEGKSEFPKGLRGTRAILAYYLDAVGRNLHAGSDRTDDLIPPTKAAMLRVAGQMARNRSDFLTRAEAISLVSEEFASYVAPPGRTWMEVLQLAGLLRLDPPAGEPSDDPLDSSPDIVRFSFQRFQDHLMGQALLAGITDVQDAFKVGGELSFMVEGDTIVWEWQGLMEALSSLVPEQFKLELVDVLPGKFEKWWRWPLSHGFVESAKWRSHDAFSDRSLELLNMLHRAHEDSFELLVELSVSAGHPWNAELLHKNLIGRELWDRDRFWTEGLNGRSDDETAPVGRLIDWCRVGQSPATSLENQRLAALTLCWFFTTTNRTIRDKATKALTTLFLRRRELFPELLTRFVGVNDMYVLERLLAAAFGACCLDQSSERVAPYASAVAAGIFGPEGPPLHLLVRDYAFGIVELAKARECLAAGIEVDKCGPPYNSAPPSFRLTEKSLKGIAAKAGGDDILRSAAGIMGDFGQYKVKSQIEDFLTTPLTEPVKLRPRQKLMRFEEEVVRLSDGRRRAFETLTEIANPYRAGIKGLSIGRPAPAPSEESIAAWQEKVKAAEVSFVTLLTPEEFQRYLDEAYNEVHVVRDGSDFQPERINTEKAKLWVAKRAYELGWTAKRFPRDSFRSGEYSRGRAEVERIGKKYQWLALSELMCRVSDNYWKESRYDSEPTKYRYPTDIGFVRDIDPTIVTPSMGPVSSDKSILGHGWALAPTIVQSSIDEADLQAWPFTENSYKDFPKWVQRTDPAGGKWIVLFEHAGKENRYPKGVRREHGLRQQEFRFIHCGMVKPAQLDEIVSILSGRKSLDVNNWEPRGFTDDQFLLEAPWRDVWPQHKWTPESSAVPSFIDIAHPAFRYHWEDHVDAALPDGASATLPSPWLANEVNIRPRPDNPSVWYDAAGQEMFRTFHGQESDRSVLLKESALAQIMGTGEFTSIWLLIAERGAWPGGSNDEAAWRRIEGVCWLDNGEFKSRLWHEDHVNKRSRVTKKSAPTATP